MFDRKRDLAFVGAAQMFGAFVQFRVERDDATISVFEFAREPDEFLLAFLQLLERDSQFMALPLHLIERIPGIRYGGTTSQRCNHFVRSERRVRRKVFRQRNDGVGCNVFN